MTMRFVQAVVMACFLTSLRVPAASAVDVLTLPIRSELKAATQQLGEIMRRDVEDVRVDDEHMIVVPLTNTARDQTYRFMGTLVPFVVEGVNGGNAEQEFVALFLLTSPDEEMLQDFGGADNPHKHVALLAFTQLDNRRPVIPSWKDALVAPGIVTVPITINNCGGRHGMMTVHVDDDWFGPKISLAFDAGATLGPTTCLR